ncbi:MAG: mechanosensitive ion channel family protein [Chloroflexia bacterium]|nr:mechanosensitive ion channel family protein [Chloroflexia bacterium]
MIEEVELALTANPIEGAGLLIASLLIGALLELSLHPLQRWAGRRGASHRGWRIVGIVIHALRGLPTVFGITIGLLAIILLAGFSREFVASLTGVVLLVQFVAIAIAVVRGLTSLVRLALNANHATVSLINLLIRFVGALIVLTITLSVLGVPIAPLLTLLAGSSLGLSLALREPLSNLFAGLQIVAANRVRPGVYVRLSSGEEGYVSDVRWSDTTIRQLGNATVIVPNTILTTSLLINYDPPEHELSLLIPLGVHYRSDLRRVEHVILEVARGVMQDIDGAVKEFRPFLRFSEFGEYAVKCSVILRVHAYVDQYLVRHEFIHRIHERFAQEGIVIPFPSVSVSYDNEDNNAAPPRTSDPERSLSGAEQQL